MVISYHVLFCCCYFYFFIFFFLHATRFLKNIHTRGTQMICQTVPSNNLIHHYTVLLSCQGLVEDEWYQFVVSWKLIGMSVSSVLFLIHICFHVLILCHHLSLALTLFYPLVRWSSQSTSPSVRHYILHCCWISAALWIFWKSLASLFYICFSEDPCMCIQEPFISKTADMYITTENSWQ